MLARILIKFEEDLSKICTIVNKKLNALHRIANQIDWAYKREMLLNRLSLSPSLVIVPNLDVSLKNS